ncbi:hypothetical protein SLEP1_g4971 [Rubroshorea leprosula]|uniref:Uncharacterized protein n=1 Tax=Rubroshorea leprosula TaxID=152421 RepID=A0AAV5I157_9ROSI|nr:hypothetical protein SLEP1_g4971 [Rubroshorea leprosula]
MCLRWKTSVGIFWKTKMSSLCSLTNSNQSNSCSSTMGGLILYINTGGGSLIPANYREDSAQRAQFESMVCVMQSVIPKEKKSFRRIPPMKIFKAEPQPNMVGARKKLMCWCLSGGCKT